MWSVYLHVVSWSVDNVRVWSATTYATLLFIVLCELERGKSQHFPNFRRSIFTSTLLSGRNHIARDGRLRFPFSYLITSKRKENYCHQILIKYRVINLPQSSILPNNSCQIQQSPTTVRRQMESHTPRA